MAREHNWSDSYTFTAATIRRPDSIDTARRLVAAARHIRAIGTRHSFNGIADSLGTIIDLGGFAPGFAIDRERMTVTVGANTAYGGLAAYLHKQGYALHNMPRCLTSQSPGRQRPAPMAPATATATCRPRWPG